MNSCNLEKKTKSFLVRSENPKETCATASFFSPEGSVHLFATENVNLLHLSNITVLWSMFFQSSSGFQGLGKENMPWQPEFRPTFTWRMATKITRTDIMLSLWTIMMPQKWQHSGWLSKVNNAAVAFSSSKIRQKQLADSNLWFKSGRQHCSCEDSDQEGANFLLLYIC